MKSLSHTLSANNYCGSPASISNHWLSRLQGAAKIFSLSSNVGILMGACMYINRAIQILNEFLAWALQGQAAVLSSMCRYLWIDSKSQVVRDFYSSLRVTDIVTRAKGGLVSGVLTWESCYFSIPWFQTSVTEMLCQILVSSKLTESHLSASFSPLFH